MNGMAKETKTIKNFGTPLSKTKTRGGSQTASKNHSQGRMVFFSFHTMIFASISNRSTLA